ncbi:MAG: dihydroorotate dehydrogenase electron transfer subunit [Deltaproteobacteria bacterium]|nr:dihydroorotate dehydrogenase electron transfer subunit [Deltaproteobacteria bacterium]
MDSRVARVEEVRVLAPGYALLRFSAERPIEARPGQFAMVRGDWGTAPLLPRAFSLVEAGERAAILVRVVGEGTRRLAKLLPGDSLTVLSPCGKGFTDPDEDERPVLVAGGVGVAPLVFLAASLAPRRPLFLYGARTAADLVMCEEIRKAAHLVETTEDGSRGEKGLVTGALARAMTGHGRVRVYACGPSPMLEVVARVALEENAPCEVALESGMACGLGTCRGCAVTMADGTYRCVCCDGPVFDATLVYGGKR